MHAALRGRSHGATSRAGPSPTSGCGTGVLAIGAALLGAALGGRRRRRPAGDRARPDERRPRSASRGEFIEGPVEAWSAEVDTVVMNPPFGAQRRHADRPFWDAAFRTARRSDLRLRARGVPNLYSGQRGRTPRTSRSDPARRLAVPPDLSAPSEAVGRASGRPLGPDARAPPKMSETHATNLVLPGDLLGHRRGVRTRPRHLRGPRPHLRRPHGPQARRRPRQGDPRRRDPRHPVRPGGGPRLRAASTRSRARWRSAPSSRSRPGSAACRAPPRAPSTSRRRRTATPSRSARSSSPATSCSPASSRATRRSSSRPPRRRSASSPPAARSATASSRTRAKELNCPRCGNRELRKLAHDYQGLQRQRGRAPSHGGPTP